jgi:aldehyde dehydrogenase (NAD+)
MAPMVRDIKEILDAFGIGATHGGGYCGEWLDRPGGGMLESVSPIDGRVIASVEQVSKQGCETILFRARKAFEAWRNVPAPKRGEVVRQLGNEIRKYKSELGALVTWEMGKIRAEGEGEVQEAIDMADFATGLSRQLYGLVISSERPDHRMIESWHPLGPVAVITAFNFPVAVWSWNAMLALVCGDAVIWKPSSLTPLTAVACMKIADRVLRSNNCPDGLLSLIVGKGSEAGEALIRDSGIPLVSFTGSTVQGRRIGEAVGRRLGRTILELGGNNAVIVSQHADLEMAVRTILFGAVGTAGQRCTTTRRAIIHESVYDEVMKRVVRAYEKVKIGNPLDDGILMGPLVNRQAVDDMKAALAEVRKSGGKILYGGEEVKGLGSDCYVMPCVAEADNGWPIVRTETFAPILYVLKYRTIEEAIAIQNSVPQGLSSSIFTLNLREAELFLSARGSDCGIANVNAGTSGAEIGGAFGGEKETGGGRESGSDAWKQYMRRQTSTINWSDDLPLAQGIRFGE